MGIVDIIAIAFFLYCLVCWVAVGYFSISHLLGRSGYEVIVEGKNKALGMTLIFILAPLLPFFCVITRNKGQQMINYCKSAIERTKAKLEAARNRGDYPVFEAAEKDIKNYQREIERLKNQS